MCYMIYTNMRRWFVVSVLIALTLISVTIYPLPSDGVTPINNHEYVAAIHKIINNAKSSIRVMAYQAWYYTDYPGSDSNRFVDELVSAQKRGVQVFVLLETSNWNEALDKQNKDYGQRLEAGGVKVYFDNYEITSHQKVVIVDDYATVVSSDNWSHYSLWQNNEVAIIIWSKAVADAFTLYMNQMMRQAGHEPLPQADSTTPPKRLRRLEMNHVTAKDLGFKTYQATDVLPLPNREYFPSVHNAFLNARQSIRVVQRSAQYYTMLPAHSAKKARIPGEPISPMNVLMKDLIASEKRGVDVQVILDAELRKRRSTGEWNVDNSNEDFTMRLLAGGVPVYYDSLTTQTHTKMVLVDDMTIVGSTNWTHNALVDGNEASVLVKSKEVSEIYRKYFDTLKDEGLRVTPDTDLFTMKKEMEKKDKEKSTSEKKSLEKPEESSSSSLD